MIAGLKVSSQKLSRYIRYFSESWINSHFWVWASSRKSGHSMLI